MATIARIGAAFVPGLDVRLLDVHSDADHHRSVFTLAGPPQATRRRAAQRRRRGRALDRRRQPLQRRPHRARRPPARRRHRRRPARLPRRTRPRRRLRRGARRRRSHRRASSTCPSSSTASSPARRPAARAPSSAAAASPGLPSACAAGEIRPDFGPSATAPECRCRARRRARAARRLQPRSCARPPRSTTPASSPRSCAKAARVGCPALRAIGIAARRRRRAGLDERRAPARAAARRGRRARRCARAAVAGAELVGLAPRAAFEGFPDDLPLPGFDPARHLIENASRREQSSSPGQH